ncbi:MAG: citrate synthase [Pigmentiphaga sp.]|uniref:citrate synthase n=1 Tax=Pigmentiphaga sp. TaxID=1977564 RepID=UPI0029ABC17B|nr:citrate synthase [Pigmentiphaga sp.]MDX3906837.1 citrate synthase [Pigmentiphaga sp.]
MTRHHQEIPRKDYLSAKEAVALLGIRMQTLYAYVSKGWIRSVKQTDTRQRLYLREDILRVKARSTARAGHGAVAASAMNWGEPIIPTSITEIRPDGPHYRGRSAIRLARARARYESVAELLWTGVWHDAPRQWETGLDAKQQAMLLDSLSPPKSNSGLLEIMAIVTLRLGMSRGSVEDRVRSGHIHDAARQVIKTLAGCFGLVSRKRRFLLIPDDASMAEGLLAALDLPANPANLEAMEAFLVLFADHELSPSTFAARVAASGGSSLHSCIASAICSSAGIHLGRMYDRIEDFLHGADTTAELMQRARTEHAQGSSIPGFGHPLYPKGDERAAMLIELARRRPRQKAKLAEIYRFIETAEREFELHPRHELGAIVLAMAMGIPRQTVGTLFTLARMAGWVAHVQEQRLSGMLLRPRAKFVGTGTEN